MKIRGTPTDSLADVIQSLQLIHKSGLLTVEKDSSSNSSEIGRVAFRNGQILAAEAGTLKGTGALQRLMTWQTCHFLFEPSLSNSLSPITQSLPRATTSYNPISESRQKAVSSKDSSSNEYSISCIIPYRTQHMIHVVPDFQRLSLSRTHRQLFLLTDGKRSLQELARLIGRSPQEILDLLIDLERFNLVTH